MIFYVWLAALIAAIYLYCRQVYSRFSSYGVKYKEPVPLLGNMAPIVFRRKHLATCLSELYTGYPDERFVGRYEFVQPGLMIRDLELVKKVGVKDYEYFLDHRASGDIDPLFGRTLFTLKGQEWKDMRSTLSPAFTSSKIRNMIPFLEEVGDQMLKSLKKQLRESENNYIDIDCKDLAARYANDVIASCAFGLQVDSHSDPHNEFFKMGSIASNVTFLQIMIAVGHMSFPRLMKKLGATMLSKSTRSFFYHLVMSTMREREERNILRPDMIHLLMEAKRGRLTHEEKCSKKVDTGFATVEESDVGKNTISKVWTDTDLTAQALVFFLAGFETVSTVMSFLMYELALNPDVQDKLAKEIQEHDLKSGGKFNYDSIQTMTYLDMVVSEVLRLWPPVSTTDRLCTKDYNMGKPNNKASKDYIIKAGETLNIPIMAIHHDPQYFAEPLKFDPERFSDENKHKIKPYTYLPFGLGPRNCIGSRFALSEVKIMIYQLLLHIQLVPCSKTTIPAALTTDTFNLKLKGGHFLRLQLRK